MGDLTANFSKAEFACPCCDRRTINIQFVVWLQQVRNSYGRPMTITSGIRCPTHNQRVGGSKYSAHLDGLAVDVACADSPDRYDLVASAVKHGARGIGIYTKHIHLDLKTDGRQTRVMWVK